MGGVIMRHHRLIAMVIGCTYFHALITEARLVSSGGMLTWLFAAGAQSIL